MSKPRFFADHNLSDYIVRGVKRREPLIEFLYCRDAGLQERSDAEVLAFAAKNELIVVSYDLGTMKAAAIDRITKRERMPGLCLARQDDPIGPIIENLVLIWAASEADEWMDVVQYLPM